MTSNTELAGRALNLISETELGIFMTIDLDGCPHGRLMHLLPLHGIRDLYALTGDKSRKIAHVERHPEVAWLVHSPRGNVLLKGRAEIHHDFSELRAVWDRLASAAQRYAQAPFADGDHPMLTTIHTRVHRLEVAFEDLGPVPREIVFA